MFICLECGREFREPKHWEEYHGECFGYPAYEPMSGCPYCRGDYMDKDEYDREYGDDEESEDEGVSNDD